MAFVVVHGINPKGYEALWLGSLFSFDNIRNGNTDWVMINLALIMSMVMPSVVTNDLADRIAIIESNYNHLAVGDNYNARGAYQLHECAWIDGIAQLKKEGRSEECDDWAYRQDSFHAYRSREVCMAYLRLIEKNIIRAGYTPTKERIYMCYNLGFHAAVYRYKLNPLSSRLPDIRKAILRRAKFYLNK